MAWWEETHVINAGGGGGGGATCATAPELFCLGGRAGGQEAFGGTVAGDGLDMGSESATGVPGFHLYKNGLGNDRLTIGPDFDPTSAFVPGGAMNLVVTDETDAIGAVLGLVAAGDNPGIAPAIFGFRSHGTLAAPTASDDGDVLFSVFASGYDSNDDLQLGACAIDILQDGAAQSGFVAARVNINTYDQSGNLATNFTIRNGKVGINEDDPQFFLDIDGDLSVAGMFEVGTDGNIDKIKNQALEWPAANAFGALVNDSAGNLSWSAEIPFQPAGTAVDLTGNTADIGSTVLFATPASPSLYRVTATVVVTTAGSVSSTMPSVDLNWTDSDTTAGINLQITPTNAGNATGTYEQGSVVINADGGTNISYSTNGYASTLAGMEYAIHIRLEAIV